MAWIDIWWPMITFRWSITFTYHMMACMWPWYIMSFIWSQLTLIWYMMPYCDLQIIYDMYDDLQMDMYDLVLAFWGLSDCIMTLTIIRLPILTLTIIFRPLYPILILIITLWPWLLLNYAYQSGLSHYHIMNLTTTGLPVWQRLIL